ncbi:hypothetical protein C8R45DRAFT_1003849 [Mycena sanguinolenta]|nr:hypothetical protein C8R45DRAFT_1003849 [Mycena sanguinolenta]
MISISKLAFPSFSPFISHARALPGNTSAIRRQRARTPKLPNRLTHLRSLSARRCQSGQGARARYGVCSGAQTRSAYGSRTGDRERVTGWSRESGWCADAPRHANDLRCHLLTSRISRERTFHRSHGSPLDRQRSRGVDAAWGARARCSSIGPPTYETYRAYENPMDLSISSCISHATDGNSCVARTRLATRESGARARRRTGMCAVLQSRLTKSKDVTESLASAGKDGAP